MKNQKRQFASFGVSVWCEREVGETGCTLALWKGGAYMESVLESLKRETCSSRALLERSLRPNL